VIALLVCLTCGAVAQAPKRAVPKYDGRGNFDAHGSWASWPLGDVRIADGPARRVTFVVRDVYDLGPRRWKLVGLTRDAR